MMVVLKSVKHADISIAEINEIIEIKSVAWPYSFAEHQQWIASNLKDSDIHLMLREEGSIVAYLNLVSIELKINESNISAYGIGNVCAKHKGKGYGSLMLEASNNFLITKNKMGLLFCKNALVNFYKRNGWQVLTRDHMALYFQEPIVNVMTYNCKSPITHLEYQGNIF